MNERGTDEFAKDLVKRINMCGFVKIDNKH